MSETSIKITVLNFGVHSGLLSGDYVRLKVEQIEDGKVVRTISDRMDLFAGNTFTLNGFRAEACKP